MHSLLLNGMKTDPEKSRVSRKKRSSALRDCDLFLRMKLNSVLNANQLDDGDMEILQFEE